MVLKNVDTVELWHKRLGYTSEKGMMVLSQKNHLSRMTSTCLQKGAHCLGGSKIELLSRHLFFQERRICLTWSTIIYMVQ